MPGSTYRPPAGSAGSRGGVANSSDAFEIVGLAQFRRDLGKIDKDLSKEINRYLRQIATSARDTARSNAPLGATGKLRRSIKHSVKSKEMSLYSDLEYAPAHEWGTSGKPDSKVQPRGVPIRIKRSQMLGRAVFTRADDIENHLLGLVDHLAQVNGFDD
ncbi:MAG TPA: HK97 gp10 family phage protein [Solirubrobacterales bacterium]|nr:HK97 gp10 family phage protein [Solirubrobacterales bacterium]